MIAVAADGVIDGKVAGLRMTFDYGQIESFDLAATPGSRELWENFWRTGEEHRAAGHTVEAVDEAQERPLTVSPGE